MRGEFLLTLTTHQNLLNTDHLMNISDISKNYIKDGSRLTKRDYVLRL